MSILLLPSHFLLVALFALIPLKAACPLKAVCPLKAACCQSTIIFLKGSCSSGKSTLIQSLDTASLHLEVIDEDAVVHRRYPEAVCQKFPKQYAAIERAIHHENQYHALRTEKILYKSAATEEERRAAHDALMAIKNELNQAQNKPWKEQVSQSITSEILLMISTAVQGNKNILLDAWYITPKQLEEQFPQAKTVRVLLYCPLSKAYERYLKRNRQAIEEGTLTRYRLAGQLIGSFCSLYQISQQPEQPIEKCDVAAINQIFDSLALSLGDDDAPKPVFTLKDLSKNQLRKLQEEFLRPCIHNDPLTFYISPKERQDYIIDTSVTEPQRQIRELLQH